MEENKLATRIFFCSLFTALVLLSCPAPVGGKSYDFNYDPLSDNGPAHWGDLQPDWYKCKNGTMQSPINLSDADEMIYSKLQTHYKGNGVNTFLYNTGQGIALLWQRNKRFYIIIDQTRYYLQSYQWHSPAEHAINGRRYDLELQILHRNDVGQYAAVAILYQFGRPADNLLESLMYDLEALPRKKYATKSLGLDIPEIELRRFGINNSKYFRYNGSLTTPPCSEGVIWIVLTEIKTVTKFQVKRLQDAVMGNDSYTNARPLQPRNNRPVKLCTQK